MERVAKPLNQSTKIIILFENCEKLLLHSNANNRVESMFPERV